MCVRRVRALALMGAVSLIAGACSSSAVESAPSSLTETDEPPEPLPWPLPPTIFRPASGWNTLSSDPFLTLDPEEGLLAWAVNVPLTEDDFSYATGGSQL